MKMVQKKIILNIFKFQKFMQGVMWQIQKHNQGFIHLFQIVCIFCLQQCFFISIHFSFCLHSGLHSVVFEIYNNPVDEHTHKEDWNKKVETGSKIQKYHNKKARGTNWRKDSYKNYNSVGSNHKAPTLQSLQQKLWANSTYN